MKKTLLCIPLLIISVLGYSADNCKLATNPVPTLKTLSSDLVQVLYFTTRGASNGGVHMVILNDNTPQVVDFASVPLSRPYGITVDTANSKVYVSDYSISVIYRFDADGTNPLKILDGSVVGQEICNSPEALMVVGNKLYWGAPGGIFRCDLDGANPEIYNASIEFPIDMLYNPTNNMVYLVNEYLPPEHNGGYYSLNLDGTGLTQPIPNIDGTAIELDMEAGKVYIAGYGDAGPDMPLNAIYMANIDGTSIVNIGNYGPKAAWGIAIDNKRGKLFWSYKMSNINPDGKIIRANLDGSGQEDWITGVNPNAMEVAWIKQAATVGIEDNIKVHLQVYPNPAINNLHVKGEFNNARIELCAPSGQIIYTSENQSQQADIDVSLLKKGFYLLRINTSKGVIVKKIALIK